MNLDDKRIGTDGQIKEHVNELTSLGIPFDLLAPTAESFREKLMHRNLFLYYSRMRRYLELADMWISRKTSFKRYKHDVEVIRKILDDMQSMFIDGGKMLIPIRASCLYRILRRFSAIDVAMDIIFTHAEKVKVNKRFLKYMEAIRIYSVISSTIFRIW